MGIKEIDKLSKLSARIKDLAMESGCTICIWKPEKRIYKHISAAESIVKSLYGTISAQEYESELVLISNILEDFYGKETGNTDNR